MASVLVQLLKKETIRGLLRRYLSQDDLKECRLVCQDLAVLLAPLVFAEITIVFRSSTLTRPSHLAVLGRIGRHTRTLTFKMSHTNETFLPPVINSITGKEQTFVYMPQSHQTPSKTPRYGSWEMTDLLVKQYPPLFHAATDVRSFVKAFSSMPNLRHLCITCEGQTPSHRYRRGVVDYALVSLRMAVEQAPLRFLDRLSLLSVHPAAILYLQPTLGLGASPASRKRWLQIRHLTIHMTSFPYETGPTDHLKLLHAYLQSFPTLQVLRFHWQGHKGLSPISLATEPCLQRQPREQAAGNDISKARTSLRPLRLPHLQAIELVNVTIDACQVACFILDHRYSLCDLNLRDIDLRNGSWDEALAPLTRLSGSDRWKEAQQRESMICVPIVLGSGMQLQKTKQAAERQRTRPSGLRKTRGCDYNPLGRPDHMKRLLPVSVLSWR